MPIVLHVEVRFPRAVVLELVWELAGEGGVEAQQEVRQAVRRRARSCPRPRELAGAVLDLVIVFLTAAYAAAELDVGAALRPDQRGFFLEHVVDVVDRHRSTVTQS